MLFSTLACSFVAQVLSAWALYGIPGHSGLTGPVSTAGRPACEQLDAVSKAFLSGVR